MGLFTSKTDETKKDKVNGKAKEGGLGHTEKTVKVSDAKKDVKKTAKKSSMKDLYSSTKTSTRKVASNKKAKDVKTDGSAYRVLVKPLITEKAADLGAQDKYVFEVSVRSNKIEVAKAIDEVYGVMPIAINIINMKGKLKRQGRKIGKRKNWKKAIITLPKGKTINVYEGV
jgi:large subunit ribosomal protein L23